MPRTSAPVSVSRAVLECISSVGSPIARTKLIKILKGSNAKGIRDAATEGLRTYGSLRHLSLVQISSVIDQLARAGFVRAACSRRPMVKLTALGQEALDGGISPEVEIPDELKLYAARERCRRCPHNPMNATVTDIHM